MKKTGLLRACRREPFPRGIVPGFALCTLVVWLSVAPMGTPAGMSAADSLSSRSPLAVPLLVKNVADFEIDGSGTNPAWEITEWNRMTKLDEGGHDYPSNFKILYSLSGIYLLFQGQDNQITTSDYQDMDRIWNGDVFEVFFHPDPKQPVYFEYEVNPFGRQLLLTISNSKDGVGWVPFDEDGRNNYGTDTKTQVFGGPLQRGGTITSWMAEVFLSYKSLGLLPGMPPKSGTVWNANFCRLDHDTGKMIKWSWAPDIKKSLHELDKFRSVIFE